MHEGCSASFESGKEVADKVRMMGFDKQFMPMPLNIECECSKKFVMELYEGKCPECGMVFAVTPCHASDAANVMPAGINY